MRWRAASRKCDHTADFKLQKCVAYKGALMTTAKPADDADGARAAGLRRTW